MTTKLDALNTHATTGTLLLKKQQISRVDLGNVLGGVDVTSMITGIASGLVSGAASGAASMALGPVSGAASHIASEVGSAVGSHLLSEQLLDDGKEHVLIPLNK